MTYFVVVDERGGLRVYNSTGYLGTWGTLDSAFTHILPNLVIIIGPSGPCV